MSDKTEFKRKKWPCPECGEKIDYLDNICPVYQSYVFTIEKDGETHYNYDDGKDQAYEPKTWDGDGEISWGCPECGQELFYSEDAATEFLQTGN